MSSREQGTRNGEHIEQLSDSITVLAQQIEVLRNVLDEIREDFSWAIRNDLVSQASTVCQPVEGVRESIEHPQPPQALPNGGGVQQTLFTGGSADDQS